MTIQVGRVSLPEATMRAFEESWSADGNSVSLSGIIHSGPTRSRQRMAGLHDDLLGLPLALVPVELATKNHRNGYYRVLKADSSLIEIAEQNLTQLVWKIDLQKLGNDDELDLESRLSGPINRLNDHSLGGERWHAPAGAHAAYWIGSATPGQVVRTGLDGPIIVYRSLPIGNPRWACDVADYDRGRVMLVDLAERSGVGIRLGNTWILSNSLMGLSPSGTGFAFYAVSGAVTSTPKLFNFTLNGTPLGAPLSVSVLHNQYERVTVRCVWNRSPSGRIYADITLRRGSRFAEIVLKANASATLGIVRGANEAATAGAGFIRATSNDANGHRYIIGSLRSFTSDLVAGGIAKASTVRLDAIVGYEVGGSAAVAGDQAAQLMGQYVGTPSEVVQAVRR